jgi:hypothetical protein
MHTIYIHIQEIKREEAMKNNDPMLRYQSKYDCYFYKEIAALQVRRLPVWIYLHEG